MRVRSIRALLDAHAFFTNEPLGTIPTGDWADHEWGADKFFRWFDGCLHDKINRDDPRNRWRKCQPDYQLGLHVDAMKIRDYTQRRIRNSGCRGLLRTPDLQRRFPHVNQQERW